MTYGNKFIGGPESRCHTRHESEQVRNALAGRDSRFIHFENSDCDSE